MGAVVSGAQAGALILGAMGLARKTILGLLAENSEIAQTIVSIPDSCQHIVEASNFYKNHRGKNITA